MDQVYLVAGVRTPFGRYGGALAAVRPDDLLAGVIAETVVRTGVDPAAIDDVVAGCVIQSGEDARNVGRNAALAAGLPSSVPGVTINRLCGSSLSAALDAARVIATGQGDIVLACGVESMSRAPFILPKSDGAFARAQQLADSTAGVPFPNPRLTATWGADSMAQTADNIARDLRLSRERCDRYAARSQRLYSQAAAAGFFDDEIVPVTIIGKKNTHKMVESDEHPRPETSFETLTRLSALSPGGVVTAGNASGINDGASAVLLANSASLARLAAPPLAVVVTGAVTGIDPRIMGLGPVAAIRRALDRAGLGLDQIDVIEINEAFASQVLGCLVQLGIEDDDSRINPGGGAIALGHPLGASGTRLLLTAARRLQAQAGRYAVVAMCIGLGQGIAVVIERV
jgi:acetyl-CoA C-acetyltransferase